MVVRAIQLVPEDAVVQRVAAQQAGLVHVVDDRWPAPAARAPRPSRRAHRRSRSRRAETAGRAGSPLTTRTLPIPPDRSGARGCARRGFSCQPPCPPAASPAPAASERDVLDEPLPRDYSAANSRGHGGGSAPSRDGWSQGSRNAGGLVHRWLLGGVALSTLMLVACTRGAAPAAAPPATAGASAAAVTRDVTVRVAHVSAPTSLYEMDAQDYGTRSRPRAAAGSRFRPSRTLSLASSRSWSSRPSWAPWRWSSARRSSRASCPSSRCSTCPSCSRTAPR